MEKIFNYEDNYLWQDREIRFDILKNQLALRQGEKAHDTIANVEDTKGNNGDIGTLISTNLRLVWYCQDNMKMNLSIGYDCVQSFEIKSISTKIAGNTKALAVKCKFNNNRFEFVFNSISDLSPLLFSSFQTIYRSYDTTRSYRDLKMKGFLTNDKNLINLCGEVILLKKIGVSNVNNDQAMIGALILTNIRIVWYSSSSDAFNLSLPWIQIRLIKLKELPKNGKVLAIEIGKAASVNCFHFKFNEKVEGVINEIESFYKVNMENPILGEDLNSINNSLKQENNTMKNSGIEQQMQELNKNINSKFKDGYDEISETNYFNDHANILHYMTSNQDKKISQNDIVYSNELGLAIEKLPDNISIDNLWRIIPI